MRGTQRFSGPLANKLPKLTRDLATVACDLTYSRLSHQNRTTQFFLKFSVFEEQNTFQKQLKHSKIFLYLNQQRLSM